MVKKQSSSVPKTKKGAPVILGRARSRSFFGDFSTVNDFKNSALFISLLINLFFLVGYLLLQATSKYDTQVANFLFN